MKKIKHNPAGRFEDTRFEKIHNVIFDNSTTASIAVAKEIATLIQEKAAKKSNLYFRFSNRVFTYKSI